MIGKSICWEQQVDFFRLKIKIFFQNGKVSFHFDKICYTNKLGKYVEIHLHKNEAGGNTNEK